MKIFAISDQHGFLPEIPPCDLLLVAGDLCPDGIGGVWARHQPRVQIQWFDQDWMIWRRRQPAKHCLVTWGNHDFGGQHIHRLGVKEGHGPILHCGDDTDIVVDGLVEYDGLKIWLSPWSHRFMDWAFMLDEEGLAEKYAPIPEGIDILVSHDTPYGYGDAVYDLAQGSPHKIIHVGGKSLLETIDRVRPQAVVCGHIHGGHGIYKHELPGEHSVGGQGTEFMTTDVTIYNVSLVDEQYKLVHGPTEIVL